jgi:hypothetical protein
MIHMQLLRTPLSALLAAAGLACAALAAQASPQPAPEPAGARAAVEKLAREVSGELAASCPLAPAGDTAAYNACRRALFGDSKLRAALPPVLLWGRQSKNPDATLRQTHLTQFAPDVWTNMYAPLFMFNGRHTVEWVPHEKRFLVRMEAAFRNRLAPGQFPYPFWHEDDKWGTYEKANGFMLWVDPATAKVQVAQFTSRAPNAMLHTPEPVRHAFDGKWLWTDERGQTQPAVTLFDGVYRAENPYIRTMDRQYRDLAIQMRESQCTSCHVPDNPDKMSRLVLLSTPVHAAGEIDRIIKSVKEDRMPMDEYRISYALSAEQKKWLLERAEAFKATVQAAREWELQAAARSIRPVAAGSATPATTLAWQPATSAARSQESAK